MFLPHATQLYLAGLMLWVWSFARRRASHHLLNFCQMLQVWVCVLSSPTCEQRPFLSDDVCLELTPPPIKSAVAAQRFQKCFWRWNISLDSNHAWVLQSVPMRIRGRAVKAASCIYEMPMEVDKIVLFGSRRRLQDMCIYNNQQFHYSPIWRQVAASARKLVNKYTYHEDDLGSLYIRS